MNKNYALEMTLYFQIAKIMLGVAVFAFMIGSSFRYCRQT